MLFFHGTSNVLLPSIEKDGLKKPYLTNQLELADYYAECAVDEVGGQKIILEVEVEEKMLCFDKNAFDEPVGFGGLLSQQIMENIELDFIEIISKNPTWYVNGIFKAPEEAYTLSLDYVGSCYSKVDIQAENITIAKATLS